MTYCQRHHKAFAPIRQKPRRRRIWWGLVASLVFAGLPMAVLAQDNQPKELRVIDRATARRMAEEQQRLQSQPHRPTQHEFDSSRRNLLRDESQNVQQASYQTPTTRVYQTPPPNLNPYDTSSMGYGPQSMPFYPQPGPPMGYASDYPYGTGSNGLLQAQPVDQLPQRLIDQGQPYAQYSEPYQPQPPYEMIDDTRGEPAPEHPFANPQYGGGQNRNEFSANMDRPVYAPQLNQGYHGHLAGPQTQHYGNRSHGNSMQFHEGQGYLQHGSVFQGNQLRGYPQTATEKALELQNENEQLREALKRIEAQLQTRTHELEDAQTTLRQKEDELKMMLGRISDLRDQVAQVTNEKNAAIEERHAIERRCNEQLKGIETMLDGVLMNQLSSNGEPPSLKD